jgi:hypothetical protein
VIFPAGDGHNIGLPIAFPLRQYAVIPNNINDKLRFVPVKWTCAARTPESTRCALLRGPYEDTKTDSGMLENGKFLTISHNRVNTL